MHVKALASAHINMQCVDRSLHSLLTFCII